MSLLSGNKLKKFMKLWNFVNRVKAANTMQRCARKYIKFKKSEREVRRAY